LIFNDIHVTLITMELHY